MKKVINNPLNVVKEMLEGLVDVNPEQALLEGENVILRANSNGSHKNEVAIISGGGSGHEPAHAGYVGEGMLHAAVCGDVFTSPSSATVLAAIRACAGKNGVLLIVKNYTGDRLNFGLAAEMARAEGMLVEMVIVADDVALDVQQRRGIAGTVLVHKIAGATAARGANLLEVKQAALDAIANLATMGVALGSCSLPAANAPSFELADNEIELGLGIHGEKGVQRAILQSADSLVETLLTKILSSLKINAGDEVAVLVNGLGGTTAMELAIAMRHAMAYLRAQKITVARAWQGNFMTALEMAGFSISLLRLNSQRKADLDYPVRASAWSQSGKIPSCRQVIAAAASELDSKSNQRPALANLKKLALNVADALAGAEQLLTDLDSATGDGDLGMSMCRGAQAIRNLPESAFCGEIELLTALGAALGKTIAGSSGPFYATALYRAARHLATQEQISDQTLAEAFNLAVAAISNLGGAKMGDRTMLDALQPAAEALSAGVSRGLPLSEAWTKAVNAGEDGAKKTAQMLPKLGRASYLGERALGHYDAGAMAVVVWLKALAK